MHILKILIGFLALCLAWSFMFRTGMIFKINSWLKEHIFNDQVLLYSRRRLAILLFFLGLISLFSGIEHVGDNPPVSKEVSDQLLRDAQYEFQHKHYRRAVNIGKTLTKIMPENKSVWELLMLSHQALSDKDETLICAKVLMGLDPQNTRAKKIVAKLTSPSQPHK